MMDHLQRYGSELLWGMNNILAFVSGVMIMVVSPESFEALRGMTRMVDGR
jgi:hypothetical protein